MQNFGAYPLLQAYAIACPVSNMGLFGPKKVFAKKWAYFAQKGLRQKMGLFWDPKKGHHRKKGLSKFFGLSQGEAAAPPVSCTYATIDREEATMHKEDVARV